MKQLEAFGIDRVITSDEAWFYVTVKGGRRRIQHLRLHNKRQDAEVYTVKSHSIGIMCWLGISKNGIIGPIFVAKGAKINSEVYIKAILKFTLKTASQLYPDKKFLWQYDSAPAHASTKTATYMSKRGIKYVKKEEWLPCSPDLAPCDYFL